MPRTDKNLARSGCVNKQYMIEYNHKKRKETAGDKRADCLQKIYNYGY